MVALKPACCGRRASVGRVMVIEEGLEGGQKTRVRERSGSTGSHATPSSRPVGVGSGGFREGLTLNVSDDGQELPPFTGTRAHTMQICTDAHLGVR
jgi:hypothetical protein